MSEKSSGCPPPHCPSTTHLLPRSLEICIGKVPERLTEQGSSAKEHPGCEQTPAGWKVQHGFSKGAESCASRDKLQPLQMTKSCDPGQVTLLQQIRHVLVWLFSGSKCNIQIVYYKNLCLRTVQPTFCSTKSCDLDAQLLVVHKSFSNSRVFIC